MSGYTRCSIEVEKLKKLLIPNIDHPHLKQILVNNLDALNSLQIENSKLKEEIEKQDDRIKKYIGIEKEVKALEKDNKKLQEENEKLTMLGSIQTEPNTTNKDWEVIARNKTKILQKYLPDYKPLFYPGSDTENIEGCFKKLIKKYEEEIKELKENRDYWKAEWEKDHEQRVLEQDINEKLKEEIKDLKKQYHKEFVKGEYKTMVKEDDKEEKIYNLELENKQLKGEIKHKDNKFYEFCEENKKLREENDKLIDELECRYSTWETKEKEYEAEIQELQLLVDKNTNIVEYLNTKLEKYKTTLQKLKTECDKAKEIKGIMVNEDKTIITINDVELTIGDKFITYNTTYTLKQIYIGKSGKYSLRTDKNTIRLGNKYITGKDRIYKE